MRRLFRMLLVCVLSITLVCAPVIAQSAAQSTPPIGEESLVGEDGKFFIDEVGNVVVISEYDVPESELEPTSERIINLSTGQNSTTKVVAELESPEECRGFEMLSLNNSWFLMICATDGRMIVAMSNQETTLQTVVDRFLSGKPNIEPPGFEETAEPPGFPSEVSGDPKATPTSSYVDGSTEFMNDQGEFLIVDLLAVDPDRGKDAMDLFAQSFINGDIPDSEFIAEHPAPKDCRLLQMLTGAFGWFMMICVQDNFMLLAMSQNGDTLVYVAEKFLADEPDLVPPGFKEGDAQISLGDAIANSPSLPTEEPIPSPTAISTPFTASTPQPQSNTNYTEGLTFYRNEEGTYVSIGIHKNPFESVTEFLEISNDMRSENSDYEILPDPPENCAIFIIESTVVDSYAAECANEDYIMTVLAEDESLVRDVADRFVTGQEDLAPPGFVEEDN